MLPSTVIIGGLGERVDTLAGESIDVVMLPLTAKMTAVTPFVALTSLTTVADEPEPIVICEPIARVWPSTMYWCAELAV